MISKQLPLYDLAEWKNGLAFRKIDFSNKGKPVIKIAELKNGITGQTQFTNGNYGEAVSLTRGDMVFSWSGNPETSIDVFWYDLPDGWLNQHIFKVTPSECVDKKYLYYLLKSLKPTFTAIASNKQTTGLGHVTIKDLKELIIDLPTRSTQEAISNYLYALDSKIHLNKQLNDNLQQQAELLYHERFETADRSNLPVGWRIVRLGDVATISKKSFNPAKEPEMLLEHYSIPAFDEAHFPVFELSTAIKSNKFVVDNTCFMISKLNPTTKRVWKPYCLTENAVCSTEFIVYKANRQEITDFLYSVIDSSSFSDFMCSHVTGSTGSRQRTTPSDTLAFELILPTAEAIAEYQGIVSPMFEQIKCNAIENDELKRLRDSLLPKLMSGEIDVSSIQL